MTFDELLRSLMVNGFHGGLKGLNGLPEIRQDSRFSLLKDRWGDKMEDYSEGVRNLAKNDMFDAISDWLKGH